jgi:phosphate:Na+ symporter
MIFTGIGGLGLFLLGMKNMSDGMQAVAGKRMRKLISAVTNNRLMACGVGVLITCLIQSSSVTTVMVVGFVNSGFMTLMQAVGVIIGANIGTTITGWILALKIGKYGLPILGLSALVYLFARKDRTRYTAMAIMGVGMVFFGLETMASGFKTEATRELLLQIFSLMKADSYWGVMKCALTGCIATGIVQSSSATLGITIALALAGVLDFTTAAALVLGLNIGTTITAFLASIGASTNARRAAYAHVIFNVVGTLWLIPFFFPYAHGVETLVDNIRSFFAHSKGDPSSLNGLLAAKIALSHTGFNVINTILFLPLMQVLTRVVTFLVPDRKVKEIPHLTYLDVHMLSTPTMALEQSRDEIIRMSDHVKTMYDLLTDCIKKGDYPDDEVQKIFHREEVLDVVQREITEFLTHVLSGAIGSEGSETARSQLRMADEYESISDYLVNILKLELKRTKSEIVFSPQGHRDILELHNRVADYIALVADIVRQNKGDLLPKVRTQSDQITHFMKDARSMHLARLGTQEVTPVASLIFTDILNAYRRAKDHALNIAEAVAGEK